MRQRILTIIALAMGGEGIDAIRTAGAVPVSLIVVFLAGVGGWSDEGNRGVGEPLLYLNQNGKVKAGIANILSRTIDDAFAKTTSTATLSTQDVWNRYEVLLTNTDL